MSYLTQRRRALLAAMGGNKALPYDAEIEYLGSTGAQFIDTGIIPTSSTGIGIEITNGSNTDNYFCGLRNDSGNTRWCIGTSLRLYAAYGSVIDTSTSDKPNGTFPCYLNYLNSKKFTSSVSQKEYDLPSLLFTPLYNIRLFGSAGISAGYAWWSGKIHWAKISDGESIIMDLIPVRVGSVGYMYDKISGRLLGNDGTGNFVLGNDITN